jgi:hypothetical protein
VLCVRGIRRGFTGDGESRRAAARRKKRRRSGGVRVSRGGQNAPEGEREGETESTGAGWRHPAATLD